MLLSARRLSLFLVCLILLLSMGIISPSYLAWRSVQTDKISLLLPPQYAIPLAKAKLVQTSSMSAQLAQSDTGALVTAKSYAVIDVETGTVLMEKNFRLPLPPASTVKMMTALVARGYLAPSDQLSVVASDSADESRTIFAPGVTMSMSEWLKALLVPSSNTAARVLARNIENHGTNFLAAFNQHGHMYGLTDSKFLNATGIDAYGQMISARDEALLARKLIADDQLRQVVATANIELIASPSGQKYPFANTNELLKSDPSVKGVKTGTTAMAGEVLVSLFDKPPHQYLVVVMGSQDRFSDTLNLIAKAERSFDFLDINWQSAGN